jgi:hypothetical protein
VGNFKVLLMFCFFTQQVLICPQEGTSCDIQLKAVEESDAADDGCDEPDIIKRMIQHIYHCGHHNLSSPGLDTWPPMTLPAGDALKKGKISSISASENEQDGDEQDDLVILAKLYAAATKYQVPAVRTLATYRFRTCVAAKWDTDDFAPAVHIVNTTTADNERGLRDIVV